MLTDKVDFEDALERIDEEYLMWLIENISGNKGRDFEGARDNWWEEYFMRENL